MSSTLLNSIEDVAKRVASSTAIIWASQETKLLNNIISVTDSDEMTAIKMSAFLSASEFASDVICRNLFPNREPPPSLSKEIGSMGVTLATNAVTLYAIEKLRIDDMIIPTGTTGLNRAFRMAVLLALVQEVSHLAITKFMN